MALVTRNHNPNILPKVLEVPNPIFSMQFPDLISTRLRDWTRIILLSHFVGDTECFGTSVTSPFNVTIIFYPPKKNAGLERCEANTLDPRNHTQTQASISNLRWSSDQPITRFREQRTQSPSPSANCQKIPSIMCLSIYSMHQTPNNL